MENHENDKAALTKKILNKCNIVFDNFDQLNRQLVPREILLNDEIYNLVKSDIPELKKIFSSSYLTSLHSSAEKNQRWPLINIVRQILKQYNFLFEPVRKSDGYTEEGKKKYKRYFLIKKMETPQLMIND